jgi:hypothetical protein
VLGEEVACGRVVEENNGGYRLVESAFRREVLRALKTALGPIEPELHEARSRDLGAPGGDETPRSRLRPPAGSEAGREAVSA